MRAMRDQQAYRGPDGAGEYIIEDEGIYLGHRRLSIIDPEPRSAQPYVDNKSVITFNGEIYNYLELRKELGSHVSFETTGDTEVLLKSWQHWGEDCLHKIDGMYAFAINDQKGLHLVTDVFGEKPLYLYENESGIYFSSEAEPLIRHCGIEWKPEQNSLNCFINLGYVCPPHTGYEGLENLPPATHITISPNGKRTDRTYWNPELPELRSGPVRPLEESQIDDICDLLCKSLERRLRSDVPIGLFLSGGVDSSLVAALATKELGASLQSYTVAFHDSSDESEYAANIAKYLGMQHTIISSKQDNELHDTPRDLIDLYGVPNDNMTGLAVEKMCESAKKYLTVALSGIGGDELFFGYNKYEHLYKNRALYSLSPYTQTLLPLLNLLPFSKAKTAIKMLRGNMESQYLELKNFSAQKSITEIGCGSLGDCFHWINTTPLYMQVRAIDLHYSMPQSHIPAIDRGSMRKSVEVRTPFLNRKLLAYIWNLDQRALIHYGKKGVLKKLLERYMPLTLLTPGKQGFVYSLSHFFEQENEHFSLPSWVEGADDIIKNAKAGLPGYERLALRLCILNALDN